MGTTAVEKCKGLTTFMYTIPYLLKYVDKSAQKPLHIKSRKTKDALRPICNRC